MVGNPPKLKIPAVEVDTQGWLNILRQHFTWYPEMQLQDVYKLLYQGVMGSEHLAPSRQKFISRLQKEFDSLPPDIHLTLLEPIRADRKLFRLNLRAYKTHQPSIDPIISFFLDTVGLTSGTKVELVNIWHVVAQWYDQSHREIFSVSSLRQFNHWLEQENYPAVHHSEVYRENYQPSYRLISDQFIPLLGVADAS